jgi:hypothetical protein
MEKSFELVPIEIEYLPKCWAFIANYIDDICENSDYMLNTIKIFKDLNSGYLNLWFIHELRGDIFFVRGIVIAGIEVINDENRLVIYGCAGRQIDEWLHLMNELEDFAVKNNCRYVSFLGRKGWGKKLVDKGYHEVSVTYSKRLLQ